MLNVGQRAKKKRPPKRPPLLKFKIFRNLLVTPSAATVAPATTAAATTITATAATVTAATAAVAAPPPAAAASAWWARLAWTSFVDRQRSAFNGLPVELRDRRLGIGFRAHGHEGEAARLAGEFVLHERDFLDWSSLREKLLQFVFSRIEREIAYV
jgi:flagellar biosynthesis regulator FlaF